MKIIKLIEAQDFKQKDTWISEALFGYQYVNNCLGAMKPEAKVLEVGCGSGILLSMVKESHEQLLCEGIEPFGDGFSSSKAPNEFVKSQGIVIHNLCYEDFKAEHKYDFIYSVNVFEHLSDWRHFLSFVSENLAEDGVCIILCPNYNFPYESHFRLPLLFTKKITYALFSRYINRYEQENDCIGLWRSINLVKLSQVKRCIADLPLKLSVNSQIIDDLIHRLSTDPEFSKRQRVVGWFAKLIARLRLLDLLKLKLFENFQPYMMLRISHQQSGSE